MQKIGVVTDSTAGLTKEQAKDLGIRIVPLKIVFNSTEECLDGELSEVEFMRRLADRSQLVSTSAPDPNTFFRTYQELISHEDVSHIFSIHLSAHLSEGTKNSALIAQRMISTSEPDVKISFWDSEFNSIGTGWQAIEAAQLAKKGRSPEQIATELRDMIRRTALQVVVDGLWYLHRGGRVSRSVQIGADILSLKPIFTLKDGVVVSNGRVRKLPRAVKELVRRNQLLGPLERLAVSSEAGNSHGEELAQQLESANLVPCVERVPLSAVLAVHTGPRAFGFVALRKKG